ncbi:MAG TPA: serine hydrolase domain-containing protein [Sphingomicrobium sp.]|nr:serine hydrolase domain-containing protein [Sphingomicrobium sp.]
MDISRRAFTAGALGVALSSRFAAPALAQGSPGLTAAIAAIQAHGTQHLRTFGLPGMTLALTAPGGFATVLNFGFANADSRRPITPDTLFQVGSISKSMTAAVIHQLAAEKRLNLNDRVSTLLPTVPLPRGNTITVQHLLDHSAGLPDDSPLFPAGGLWVGYQPGEHWHYSNTGYHLLGDIAAHVGGKPLGQLLSERLFKPLGMRRSRGAIVAADRPLYAQGYEPADLTVPVVRGGPLAPAAWVDVTFGAGSIASTGDDMVRWLWALADAAQGRGGFGLGPDQARAFTSHLVPSDTPGMSYGNGLMHVGGNGRSYLHHTGGMVSFSSSFHLDVANGVGAFASSTISAFAEYRPRILTQFAVDALGEALAGRPVPLPPSLDVPLGNAAAYIGRYSGLAGTFQVRAGAPLTLVANGREAALQPWGGNLFRTTHPDFRAFTLKFDRKGPVASGANWGPASYVRDGSGIVPAKSDRALAKLAGRYINDSPWWGAATIVERGGGLWLGTETPLARIGDNLWRVGEEAWTPERASFADFVDGRPQTFIFSGEKFLRHDV